MKTLIVARYNENVEWIEKVHSDDKIIYNKGDGDIGIKIPNIGRESETYLRFICENYNTLDGVYCFCQGNPYDHCADIVREINTISKDYRGFSYFQSERMLCCDLTGLPHDSNLPIVDFCKFCEISLNCEYLHFVPGGQFYVSSDVIRRRPKSFYEKILEIVNYDINPKEGYILERIWHKIFS